MCGVGAELVEMIEMHKDLEEEKKKKEKKKDNGETKEI